MMRLTIIIIINRNTNDIHISNYKSTNHRICSQDYPLSLHIPLRVPRRACLKHSSPAADRAHSTGGNRTAILVPLRHSATGACAEIGAGTTHHSRGQQNWLSRTGQVAGVPWFAVHGGALFSVGLCRLACRWTVLTGSLDRHWVLSYRDSWQSVF